MVREQETSLACTDCGYVYSSMLGDDEVPETCSQCDVYERDIMMTAGSKTNVTNNEVVFFFEVTKDFVKQMVDPKHEILEIT